MHDTFYSFILRGELTKVSLDHAPVKSKHHLSQELKQQIIKSLCLDHLDDHFVETARKMALVYIAIAAFENSVREFIQKKLVENFGDEWWNKGVPESIRKKAKSRQEQEEKIRWQAPRGTDLINYTDFGDLSSILHTNFSLFEPHIVSLEWAKQLFDTLEKSRNVIMHSGELHRQDIERVGTNIRDWIAQVGS